MARSTHRKVEGEEKAVTESLRLARRCESNYPARHPLAILIATVAHLRLAGWAEPKDSHILHAADRLVEAIEPAPTPTPEEPTTMTAEQITQMRKLEPIWTKAREILKARLYESAWRMWMETVELRGGDNGTLLLYEPSEARRTWIERRYGDVICEAFTTALDDPGRQVKGIRFVNWALPA